MLQECHCHIYFTYDFDFGWNFKNMDAKDYQSIQETDFPFVLELVRAYMATCFLPFALQDFTI